MLIIGAGGHAKEILEIFQEGNNESKVYLYEDVNIDLPKILYKKFEIIRSIEGIKRILSRDPKFVLGIGGPELRKKMSIKFQKLGGTVSSIISNTAQISSLNVNLAPGLNIMKNVIIGPESEICEGSLINSNVTVHHDVKIGEYCEIGPGSLLTGGCKIGDKCVLGAGTIILPKIVINNGVKVGAGSVVTRNLLGNKTYIGIPARELIK